MVDFAQKFGCDVEKFGTLSTGRVEV
jgi:hypothetical protein